MTELVERSGLFAAQRRGRADSPPRRIWAQDVLVRADRLQAKLNAIRADNDLVPGSSMLAEEAEARLTDAKKAARRISLRPRPASNWWRGTLVEAAYQNLHSAEILMATLYDDAQVAAEIPEAIARVEVALDRDDPRRHAALKLQDAQPADPGTRERFAKAVQVGFEAADAEHARLRSFRNAVVGSAAVLATVLVAFIAYVWNHPAVMPLCFITEPGNTKVCAAGGSAPQGYDLLTVAALGVLGGLLSAIVSIRNMQGTSLAYDVPTALAALKLPVGALSAMGGLLLIKANFVPGLSQLDSQEQILAYAFIFGAAQQLLVGAVDRHAQQLLAAAPSKAASSARPEREYGA
ncbi:MAG TPA: hypothetical protein VHR85_12785 [Nocardioides sp.]|jgi:hypothetical protein|nr:hypothetical protein [Nocardioides sp.]